MFSLDMSIFKYRTVFLQISHESFHMFYIYEKKYKTDSAYLRVHFGCYVSLMSLNLALIALLIRDC
jgi:hypothetical protein